MVTLTAIDVRERFQSGLRSSAWMKDPLRIGDEVSLTGICAHSDLILWGPLLVRSALPPHACRAQAVQSPIALDNLLYPDNSGTPRRHAGGPGPLLAAPAHGAIPVHPRMRQPGHVPSASEARVQVLPGVAADGD
ncbi:hypothetical protein FKP32DRAFT_1596123 [Trametes sanguinea]|nr:hypothetical protein FKP32DRAFT_1596123 [Trametes sanguinea]